MTNLPIQSAQNFPQGLRSSYLKYLGPVAEVEPKTKQPFVLLELCYLGHILEHFDVTNEVGGRLYLYKLVRVKRHVVWASRAYMEVRPTLIICILVGFVSKIYFSLTKFSDL